MLELRRPFGVALRDVENHPCAVKLIFFKVLSQKLVSKQLNGYKVVYWRDPMLMGVRGPWV